MQGCSFRLQLRRQPTKSNNFTYQRKSSVAACAGLSARFHSRVSGPYLLPSSTFRTAVLFVTGETEAAGTRHKYTAAKLVTANAGRGGLPWRPWRMCNISHFCKNTDTHSLSWRLLIPYTYECISVGTRTVTGCPKTREILASTLKLAI